MCNGGDCMCEARFRLAQEEAAGKPLKGKNGKEWRFSSGPKVAKDQKINGGEKKRGVSASREAERIEKVLQLILWGPK